MDIGIVILYLLVLVGIGVFGGRRVKTADAFHAADKTYGAPVIFMSMAASFIGGGFSAGNAAATFENGIGMTVALLGFSVATILTGRYLVSGLTRFRGAHSVGDIMSRAYGKRAGIISGVFAYITCIGVIGAQVEGMGSALHALLNLPPYAGVLLGTACVLLYSTVGGLKSVIAADVVQFILLAVGMPLLLICGVSRAGGLGAVVAATPTSFFDPLHNTTLPALLSLAATFAFGEMLAPPYTERLLVGKNLSAAARGTVWGGVFSIPFFCITFLVGLTARALSVTVIPADAMPALILSVLPAGVKGVVMASMVSMMLSAADGFLNGAAVSLTEDVLVPCGLPREKRLFVLRLSNFLTGAVATVLALILPDIFGILKLAYTFWCPLILPPLIRALRGRPTHKKAFRRGVLCGFFVTVLWDVLLAAPFGVAGAPLGMTANFLCLALTTRNIENGKILVKL